MYHNFFIHSSVNGHLGCFHAQAIVNSVAMNTGVHVSLSIIVFSGYMPSECDLLGHVVLFLGCFFFMEISILFFIVAVSFYTPTNNARGFPLLHTLSSTYCL